MTLDYSKHKSILLQILKDIYSDTSIAPYLGFKGGTAALLFYDLPRNSVDLDFDLLDELHDGTQGFAFPANRDNYSRQKAFMKFREYFEYNPITGLQYRLRKQP